MSPWAGPILAVAVRMSRPSAALETLPTADRRLKNGTASFRTD